MRFDKYPLNNPQICAFLDLAEKKRAERVKRGKANPLLADWRIQTTPKSHVTSFLSSDWSRRLGKESSNNRRGGRGDSEFLFHSPLKRFMKRKLAGSVKPLFIKILIVLFPVIGS